MYNTIFFTATRWKGVTGFQFRRYIKKLQEAVKGKTVEEMKSEENQIRVTALKTTSNISTLIRDLFHTPPSFKSNVQLSWFVPKGKKMVRTTPKITTNDIATVEREGSFWIFVLSATKRSGRGEGGQQTARANHFRCEWKGWQGVSGWWW